MVCGTTPPAAEGGASQMGGAIHSHLCTSALQPLCHSRCFTNLKSPPSPWQQTRFSRLVSSYFHRVTKCRRRPFEEHHLQPPEGLKQRSRLYSPTLNQKAPSPRLNSFIPIRQSELRVRNVTFCAVVTAAAAPLEAASVILHQVEKIQVD